MMRRVFLAAVFACAAAAALPAAQRPAGHAALPARLTDREFWRLSTEFSEPNGFFRSDNLTSNELLFLRVLDDLVARTRPGGVYLGVGPEQNYTYMAATRPAMAIIFDIRRGNLNLQLMYKALFELAADRADFISMLFAKPRPAGLGARSTVTDLFTAFADSPRSEPLYNRTLRAIDDHLTKVHGLPLTREDLDGIEYVYHSFFFNGFAVRPYPTYADLMTATDATGQFRSYLATEDGYRFLKQLESKNLVVPVVGDFGGSKAIRSVAGYLKAHDAVVSTFYLSNVEQYLLQDDKWQQFCRNVAALPLDPSSTFIRSSSRGGGGFVRGGNFVSSLGAIAEEVKSCAP
jgi:hypothetical protein